MSVARTKSWRWVLLVATGCAIAVAAVVFLRKSDGNTATRELDASVLKPGGELAFDLGKRPVVVAVPDGEGFTFGSFTVRSEVVGFHSGPVERDGAVETIWVDDVSGDGREDAVILVRSGGSGSYVTLFVLEGTAAGFSLRALPALPVVGKPGYMGHDSVAVRSGVIHRSFPSYDNTGKNRVNQQWTLKDGVQGESPIKKGGDSNADPSGETVRFRYDAASGEWKLTVGADP